ncbi:MAG: DUF1552 domain-containing protein [Rhodospirillaceae bacterium]
MKTEFGRRRFLRGTMAGASITVGLPLLDCFLNGNGTALANGSALPVCFVNWFQGLGFTPGFWEPKTVGANYEMEYCLRALKPIKSKTNIFSGLKTFLDAHPGGAHVSGTECVMQGGVGNTALPSFDQIIANAVGTKTRFRSLEVSCGGNQESTSRRSATAVNPSEPSPAALYKRIFGPDFKDPNAADFTPDPQIMARASVLSIAKEERDALLSQLGASDKARIDEYFTSLRELEQRLDLELQKPAPLESCSAPKNGTEEAQLGLVIGDARANNKLFAELLVHAFACGQTQVASVNFGGATSQLRKPGEQQGYHMYTHEEAIDPVLGYQKNVEWFSNQVAESLLEFVQAFDRFREGPGTLLDRSLITFTTDGGWARVHSTENIPLMTIGNAGGRLKTGMHISPKGDTVARVGLTVMQAMGVPIGTWGSESNTTTKTITEIMA